MDSEYEREAEKVRETARPHPGGQARRAGWHWHVLRWHWHMTRHGCLLLLLQGLQQHGQSAFAAQFGEQRPEDLEHALADGQ